jgi:CheY-like chemotaxis protein
MRCWFGKDSRKPASNNCRVVPDGVEAISYLRREGAYPYAPRPDLVLLDLNLPKKGGRDVLREVKGDENPS